MFLITVYLTVHTDQISCHGVGDMYVSLNNRYGELIVNEIRNLWLIYNLGEGRGCMYVSLNNRYGELIVSEIHNLTQFNG